MNIPVFIYCELLNPTQQIKVFGRKLSGIPEYLPHFKRRKTQMNGVTFTTITPAENFIVKGVMISLDDAEFEILRVYKGQTHCRLETVLLKNGQKTWVFFRKKGERLPQIEGRL